LLIQPKPKDLDEDQYPVLIKALEEDKLRPTPAWFWELAQVYHKRYWKYNDEADMDNYYKYLKKYVRYYEDEANKAELDTSLSDNNKVLYGWYINSKGLIK
jgi:hypothetical protein